VVDIANGIVATWCESQNPGHQSPSRSDRTGARGLEPLAMTRCPRTANRHPPASSRRARVSCEIRNWRSPHMPLPARGSATGHRAAA